MKKRELALICGDGGVKGGFIAGAVTALIEKFPDDLLAVKAIAASSASVGSMFYFLSFGPNHPGKKIWVDENSAKEFLSYESIASLYGDRPIYDIDYLVREIFEKRHPLDIKAITKSTIEFYFPVQNYETNRIEYFSNTDTKSFTRAGVDIPVHDFRNHDIYEVIKAANAAPFVYDRFASIAGNHYMDAATLEPFALDLPNLIGRKKILIVTKRDRSFKRKMIYRLLGGLWPIAVNPFRKHAFSSQIYWQYARKPEVMEELLRQAERMVQNGELLLIAPTEKIGGNFDNARATLEANFVHGERIVESRLKEISEFLEAP